MIYPNRDPGTGPTITNTSTAGRRRARRGKLAFAAAIVLCFIADFVMVVSAAFLSETAVDLAVPVAIGIALLACAGIAARRSGFGLAGAVAVPVMPFVFALILGVFDLSSVTLADVAEVLGILAATWAAELVPVVAGYGLAGLPAWARRRRAAEDLLAPPAPGLGLAHPIGHPAYIGSSRAGEIRGGEPLSGWNARIAAWYVTGPSPLFAVFGGPAIVAGFLVLAASSSIHGLPDLASAFAMVYLIIVIPIAAVYGLASVIRSLMQRARRS